MAEVILDGETVNFEGSAPATSRELWSVIEGHLERSGLLIDRFLVDGVLWTPDAGCGKEAYEKVEVFSITLERNIANIVGTLLNDGLRLLDRWETGASTSLSKPWTKFQNEGLEILNETQPLVQSVGLIMEYSKMNQLSWSEAIRQSGEDLNASLSALMDSFEAADCISYSDTAATRVYPAIAEMFRVLSDEVVPSLAAKDANE